MLWSKEVILVNYFRSLLVNYKYGPSYFMKFNEKWGYSWLTGLQIAHSCHILLRIKSTELFSQLSLAIICRLHFINFTARIIMAPTIRI